MYAVAAAASAIPTVASAATSTPRTRSARGRPAGAGHAGAAVRSCGTTGRRGAFTGGAIISAAVISAAAAAGRACRCAASAAPLATVVLPVGEVRLVPPKSSTKSMEVPHVDVLTGVLGAPGPSTR